MNRIEIVEKLNEIFQDVFDDDNITVNDNTTASDIDDWDSLAHISLIVAIEKTFEIKFNMAEAVGFKTVGDMVNAIENSINKM